VLKGGKQVCQRQLVKMLGLLVTEFVRNFSREDATPNQRGSNGSLLGRIQAVKFIRHIACRHLQSRANRRRSPVARTRFKTLIYLKAFGARVRRQGRGCARSYSDHPRPADDVRAHVAAEQSAIPRGKRQDLASEAEPRRRLPLLFPHVQLHLSSRDYGG